MAENNIFTQQELNQFRPTLEVFGKLYGKKLITPLSDNVDLGFKDKEKKNIHPRLVKPVKKYFTKTIDLVQFELIKNANGKAMIIFNGDQQLAYPLTKERPEILKCDMDTVNKAILQYEETGKFSFFEDVEKVVEVVSTLNDQNAKDLEELADACIAQVSTLNSVNKMEKQAMEEYLNSLK